MPDLQDNDILVKVAYVAQNPTGESRAADVLDTADLVSQIGSTSSSGESPRLRTDVTFLVKLSHSART